MDAFLSRFRDNVERFSEKVAVSDEVRALSYREVDADSDRIAWILDADAQGENRIYAFMGRMTCECVSLNIAAGKSGTALVALDPSHPPAALREIVEHAGAARIITTPEFEDLARQVMAEDPIFLPTDAPVRDEIAPYPLVTRDPELLHFISYTSGSTGRPKGVKVSRHICDYRWKQKLDFYGTNEHDIVALFTPFWWYKHIWPLTVGGETACFDFAGRGLAALETWLREKKVTVLMAYTAMYRQLAATAESPFPDLRQIIIGGEATRVEDMRNFDRITVPGAELMTRLACQELAPLTMFVHRHGDPVDYDTVPLGRNLHPNETKLLDPEGREVPRGQPGELVTKGEFVPPGYHNDPERTAEAFTLHPDGEWSFTMGDLAWEDENGILHALGRKDQQVKIRGYNVRPTEVEEKLALHPGVAEVAVTAFEGEKGMRRLAAFFTAASDPAPRSADLRGFMSELVPGYMVPSLFIPRESLPKTSNGKLDRKNLPAPLEVYRSEAGEAKAEAATATEATLAGIWEQVLGHDNFGVEDDFFDVGGDSLQAMRMLIEAQRPLGYQLPYDTLFLDGGDIRTLAARFDQARKGETRSRLRILRSGNGPERIYLAYMRGGDASSYLDTMSQMNSSFGFAALTPRGMNDAPDQRRFDARMEELSSNCADNILEHSDPGETICLMGYSFGAVLAFDTARTLAERGHPVSRVIMIDAPCVWAQSFAKFHSVYRYFSGSKAMRFNMTPQRVMTMALAALQMGPNPPDIRDACYLALHRYVPRPASLQDVLLVQAEDNAKSEGWARTWSSHTGPRTEIVTVPGNHGNMIKPPQSHALAKVIEDWLLSKRRSDDEMMQTYSASTAAE